MKKKPLSQKIFLYNVALTCIIVLIMIIFSHIHSLDFLNWKIYDVLFNIRRHTPVKRENVVVVCIDQKSLDFVVDNMEIKWPWPREYHAQLVRYLSGCGAKAIVFDIIFSDPDIDRTNASPGENCDADFGHAIEESGMTYLAASFQDSIVQKAMDEKIYLSDTYTFKNIHLHNYETAVFPLPVLSKGAAGLGFVNFTTEKGGMVRRYPLLFKFREKYTPSIGFTIARDFVDNQTHKFMDLEQFENSKLIDKEGMFLLNWYGKGGPEGVFTYYSYHAVLASSLRENGDPPIIPHEAFKDKIIIIGSNVAGLYDLKSTPFTHIESYPGMEIHATAIENMLSGDFMLRIPFWFVIISMVFTAALLFLLNNVYKNLRVYISLFFVIIIIVILVTYVLLCNNLWIPAADILVNAGMVFAGLVISGYFTESKEKRLLRKQFERYVNDAVLEEIMENPGAVDVEGKTLTATVLATDIAGFTTISEQLSPREVVSRLNDYLAEVSESLIENSAFINKYIGDAILAVFGAFEESNHRRNACLGAVNALKIINSKAEQARRENNTPFITRFGITTGEITMGNIGSKRKTEYTVIGDTVNSAFRLEGLNKYYNTTVLVSEYTRDGIGDYFEFRLVDTIKYKGKVTSVQVYELLGLKGEVDRKMLEIRDNFDEALKFYREGNFTRARDIFGKLAEEGDKPSEVFKTRCEDFIVSPPSDWTGVWVMDKK